MLPTHSASTTLGILMASLADIIHMAMADMDSMRGSTMLAWDTLAWVEHTAMAMAWDVLSMDMDMDILAWDTLDSLAAPITSRQAQRHPPRNKFSVIKFSVIKFSVIRRIHPHLE